MKTRYFWLPFIFGFILAGLFAFSITKPFINPETDVNVFEPEYRTLSGGPFKLAEKSDKIRLVNYWSTWCKPCVAEFKDFQKLKEKYNDKFEIITISDEDISKIENFKNSKGYNFQFLHSPRRLSNYGINAIPVNVLLDKNGNPIISKVGQLSINEVEEVLNQ